MTKPAALLPAPRPERTAGEAGRMSPLRRHDSDDPRLAESVERALRATGYGSLRGIEVAGRARLVILKGRVPSYYLKQMAQETALSVPNVDQVRNDLEVSRPG